MSTSTEIKELPAKYRKYRDRLTNLLKKHDISRLSGLVLAYKNNTEFKEDWNSIWGELAREEGGKMSLTTAGLVFGAAMGGVGIAAMGSAFGLPLALILGLGGLVSGSKFDSLRVFSNRKPVEIRLPKNILTLIELDAEDSGISTSEFIEAIVQQAYAQD